MDPQLRKLLEVSWEAWIDSGVDVSSLRGSQKVGVYIGCCGSEVHIKAFHSFIFCLWKTEIDSAANNYVLRQMRYF